MKRSIQKKLALGVLGSILPATIVCDVPNIDFVGPGAATVILLPFLIPAFDFEFEHDDDGFEFDFDFDD